MEARNQVLLRIIDEAEVALAERVKEDHTFYRALLKKLIMQVPNFCTNYKLLLSLLQSL